MRCDANISLRALSEEGDAELPAGVGTGGCIPNRD